MRWQEIFSRGEGASPLDDSPAPVGIEFLIKYYKQAMAQISKCKHIFDSDNGMDKSLLGHCPANFVIQAPDSVLYNCSGML